jgi:hypothetical protein
MVDRTVVNRIIGMSSVVKGDIALIGESCMVVAKKVDSKRIDGHIGHVYDWRGESVGEARVNSIDRKDMNLYEDSNSEAIHLKTSLRSDRTLDKKKSSSETFIRIGNKWTQADGLMHVVGNGKRHSTIVTEEIGGSTYSVVCQCSDSKDKFGTEGYKIFIVKNGKASYSRSINEDIYKIKYSPHGMRLYKTKVGNVYLVIPDFGYIWVEYAKRKGIISWDETPRAFFRGNDLYLPIMEVEAGGKVSYISDENPGSKEVMNFKKSSIVARTYNWRIMDKVIF